MLLTVRVPKQNGSFSMFYTSQTRGKKGRKFDATTLCSHNIKPLSSFDTTCIWQTTSLKVMVVSMVTGWMEAREEKAKCSAC